MCFNTSVKYLRDVVILVCRIVSLLHKYCKIFYLLLWKLFQSSSRESSLCMTPKSTSLSGQVPKYGTLIPNRVFVGGISGDVSICKNDFKY